MRLSTAAFLALPFGAWVVAAGLLVDDVAVELFLLLPHAAIPSTAIKMPGRITFERIRTPSSRRTGEFGRGTARSFRIAHFGAGGVLVRVGLRGPSGSSFATRHGLGEPPPARPGATVLRARTERPPPPLARGRAVTEGIGRLIRSSHAA